MAKTVYVSLYHFVLIESSSVYTDYGRVHCRFHHLTGLSIKHNLEYFTTLNLKVTNVTFFNKSGVRMFHTYIYV